MSKLGDAFGAVGADPLADMGADESPVMEAEDDELSAANDKAELAAAKAIVKAVSGGDPEKVRTALKSFMEACGVY